MSDWEKGYRERFDMLVTLTDRVDGAVIINKEMLEQIVKDFATLELIRVNQIDTQGIISDSILREQAEGTSDLYQKLTWCVEQMTRLLNGENICVEGCKSKWWSGPRHAQNCPTLYLEGLREDLDPA